MSRADSYGAYYRDFRARLLHQTYAYCGNTEVAQRSVSDAFVSAGQHWRKLGTRADRDAWMRDQAFRATGRAQNRARKPWYVSARSTADEHRQLLAALSGLSPTDRALVILRHLVGLDVPAAGREVGVTDSAAQASLDASLAELAAAGIDPRPDALRIALDHLLIDLSDEPIDRAKRLRREGNRRRRSHTLLAGVSLLALAIGAGALTAAQSPTEATDTSTTPLGPATPTAPPQEEFTSAALATPADVRVLERTASWHTVLTSSDFGDDEPISACIAAPPTEKRADHYWVRRFSAGRGDAAPLASEALEVAASPRTAAGTYERLVDSIAVCRGASRQLLEFKTVSGIGDQASLFHFRYVDGASLRDETVAIARTGLVVDLWVVRPQAHSIGAQRLVTLTGRTVDDLCDVADGSCTAKRQTVSSRMPPADAASNGFLGTVDLPLLPGVRQGWAATPARTVTRNPSATECDRADFSGSGAADVTSRTYVVPEAKKLPAVFGMTETMGRFHSVDAARRFMSTVIRTVSRCEDRSLNLTVRRDDSIDVGAATGRVWQIDSAASENRTFVFRVGLVRVGATVAEVMFTPSDRYDVEQSQYRALMERAARRVAQDQRAS